jgi:alpha-mannosidase
MKLGLEHQNPLVTGSVLGIAGSPYSANSHSLLTVSNPNVLLWALKPHDDGIQHGLVARLWNFAAEPSRMRLTIAAPLAGVQRATHLETPLERLDVSNNGLETILSARRIESYTLSLR